MISIILPGIRPYNWERVYNSIGKSTKRDFELIIVSPYELPPELCSIPNIKFIKDFGNPVRCQQLGLLAAEGEVTGAHADDGFYYPGALDVLLDKFYQNPSPKRAISCKYLEGKDGTNKIVQGLDYFKLNGSPWTASKYFSDDWWLFNIVFMYTDYYKYLGGYNCQFETTFYSHTDLAVRAQKDGAEVSMINLMLADFGHMPDTTGDHAPIHFAHVEHDYPLFLQLYSIIPNNNIRIQMDNWKDAPDMWVRRFGKWSTK